MYLRDTQFDWYTTGLEGIATSHDASVEWIRAFLKSRSSRSISVTIAGQSSGGYAALRYSHALKPNLCIAFAPQTYNLNGQPSVALASLPDLYAAEPHNFPIALHLSRSEVKNEHAVWDDWNQIAAFLSMENVTTIRHPFDVHAVSLPLYSQGIFYETIACDMRLYSRAKNEIIT